MLAMFPDVKTFAVFNAKPHLFTYGEPFQLSKSDVHSPVYIQLTGGDVNQFKIRVEQFAGLILPDVDQIDKCTALVERVIAAAVKAGASLQAWQISTYLPAAKYGEINYHELEEVILRIRLCTPFK